MPICWVWDVGGEHEKIAVHKGMVLQKERGTGIIYNVQKPPRRDMVDLPDSW